MGAVGRAWVLFWGVMGLLGGRGRSGLFMMLMMIVFVHGIHLVKLEPGARAGGKQPGSYACFILKSQRLIRRDLNLGIMV